jgi:hypothetical protein
MKLRPIETVNNISATDFKRHHYNTSLPIVIKDMAKSWKAYHTWTWDYFKQQVGNKKVGIYNNTKSDAYTPINTADDYKTFAEYIDMIRNGKSEWRIFLFNILAHAPHLAKEFNYPDTYIDGFVKGYPMLFTGGEGSITHIHFDIDMSHILHTQFCGKKRVLLFPYFEKEKLYRKPFEVLSMVDFSHYNNAQQSKIDVEKYPAVQFAEGYETILEHGDTLFIPAGYWHHMEYIESGFALSLRAMQPSLAGKLHGLWNLFGMRSIDTLCKKIIPKMWYNWKVKKVFKNAAKYTTAICVKWALFYEIIDQYTPYFSDNIVLA